MRSSAPRLPTAVHASANFRMRSFSSAVNRRRVGLATTSGSGGTIPTGWGEAAATGDSSMGLAVAWRAPSTPRLSRFFSACMMGGVSSTLYSN